MNKKKLNICLIQLEGKKAPELNSKILNKYLIKSLKFNPDIIFTPECLNVITSNKNHLKKIVTTQNRCPVLKSCTTFAKEHNIFISVGSLLLKSINSKKLIIKSNVTYIDTFGSTFNNSTIDFSLVSFDHSALFIVGILSELIK